MCTPHVWWTKEFAELSKKEMEDIIGDGRWMDNVKFIGASGKIGSGKDHVALEFVEPLFEELNPAVALSWFPLTCANADAIKHEAIAKHDIIFEEGFHKKTEQTRKALQLRGTEEGRNKYGNYVWIRNVVSQIRIQAERAKRMGKNIRAYILDVRFPEELYTIRSLLNGQVIRIISPGRTHARMLEEANGSEAAYNAIASHASETALDHLDPKAFDFVFHNDQGTKDSVKELMATTLII